MKKYEKIYNTQARLDKLVRADNGVYMILVKSILFIIVIYILNSNNNAFADLIVEPPYQTAINHSSIPLPIIFFALLVTIVIEAVLLRAVLRVKGKFKDILLINILTNPLANISFFYGISAIDNYHLNSYWAALLIVIIEIFVIIIEAKLFERAKIHHAWKTSIILNMASFICGLVFFI